MPPEVPSSSTSSSAVMISPRIQMHPHRGSLEAHPPVSIAGGPGGPPMSMGQRGLPHPPPVSVGGGGGGPPPNLPPPAHSPRQLTSPRDQQRLGGPNPRSSPRGFGPPMENGDYIPAISGLPPHSRPAPHQLLTVVSTSGGGTIAHPHPGGPGGPSMQRGLPLPPPRQSSYAPMPPVSHHAMRAGQHGPPHGHGPPPSHHGGLPPPPTRPTAAALIGRPPMSHAFPGANPGSHHYLMDRRGGPGGLQHPDKR